MATDMHARKILTAALFSISASTVTAQTGYLCVADKATGFRYNKQSRTWESVNFNVNALKYTLTRNGGKWEWKQFGEQYAMPCQSDFSDGGLLRCYFLDMDLVQINRKSLRFQAAYQLGYVNDGNVKDDDSDTPSITIGRCTSF